MVSHVKRQDGFRLSTKVLAAYRDTIAGLRCRLHGLLTVPGPLEGVPDFPAIPDGIEEISR